MINLENKEDNKHLQEIVSLLTAKFNIEYIFLNIYVSIDTPFYELLILLSNKEIKTIGELDPQIKVALGGYHKFHHFSYAALQVRDKLRAGNLFLFSSCHPQKLVYKKADSSFGIYPEDYSPSTSLEAVHALFKREQHKIEEFKEGFCFYKERGNCEHAAFMLHQVIELSYRAIEILAIGKDRVTHSIRTHQRYLSRFAPFMSQIFKEGKDEDRAMLKRLDLIYRSTRYEDCFDVEMDELLKLESKMNQVLSASAVIYNNMVADFEKEFMVPNEKKEESVNKKAIDLKDMRPIDTLINQIAEHIDVEAIYLFGTRNHTYERKSLFESEDKEHTNNYHFDLLLVCDNETKGQVYSLESSINQSAEYSVLFLPHAQDEIQEGLSGNSRLFHEILQKGERVYVKHEEKMKWIYHEYEGKLKDSKHMKYIWRDWMVRSENAEAFITAGLNNEIEGESVRVSMFNQGLEQVFLGLLYFYYDYKPVRHSLGHLMTLCNSFWGFPCDIFPQINNEEKERFKGLIDSVKDVRYKGVIVIDMAEVYLLGDRSEALWETADKMIREYCDVMKINQLCI